MEIKIYKFSLDIYNRKEINMSNNKFNLEKMFSDKIISDVAKYQEKYGFDMGTDNNSTWNNTADAFKHAYMQAQLSLLGGKHFAKFLGDRHEEQGDKRGQPVGENNMDKWNNEQGQ